MRLDAMSQIFLSILALALFTWVGKYLFVLYYYRKKKQDINKLEARTAVLRMLLKAKLKRKGSQMQDQYKDEKEFLTSIISKLDLLTTFNFNRSSDYQDMLDILGSISEALDLHTVKKNPSIYMAQQQHIAQERENLSKSSGVEVARKDAKGQIPQYDRWSQLLKYDKGNLFIVKEIVEATADLKIKIDMYNEDQHDNKELFLRAPELIEIDGFEGLRSLVDADIEKAKAGKAAKKQNRLEDPDLAALEANDPSSKSDGSENAA